MLRGNRGVARIFGLGGQTVPCQAEPDPASTEVVEFVWINFLVFFMGLLKKNLSSLRWGGALAPPPSSYAPG